MNDKEMLLAIRGAIAKILTGGQSISLFGKSYSLASLVELNKMERYYSSRVAVAASKGRIINYKVVPR